MNLKFFPLYTLLFALLGGSLFTACNNGGNNQTATQSETETVDSEPENAASTESFGHSDLKEAAHLDKIPGQIFKIDPRKNQTIQTKHGLLVYFPEKCFVDAEGKPLEKPVRVQIKAIDKKAEYLKYGFETYSYGRILTAAGIFQIEAKTLDSARARINNDVGIYAGLTLPLEAEEEPSGSAAQPSIQKVAFDAENNQPQWKLAKNENTKGLAPKKFEEKWQLFNLFTDKNDKIQWGDVPTSETLKPTFSEQIKIDSLTAHNVDLAADSAFRYKKLTDLLAVIKETLEEPKRNAFKTEAEFQDFHFIEKEILSEKRREYAPIVSFYDAEQTATVMMDRDLVYKIGGKTYARIFSPDAPEIEDKSGLKMSLYTNQTDAAPSKVFYLTDLTERLKKDRKFMRSYDCQKHWLAAQKSFSEKTKGADLFVTRLAKNGWYAVGKPLYRKKVAFKGKVLFPNGKPAQDVRIHLLSSVDNTHLMLQQEAGVFEIKYLHKRRFKLVVLQGEKLIAVKDFDGEKTALPDIQLEEKTPDEIEQTLKRL